jgi:hypothetical protein
MTNTLDPVERPRTHRQRTYDLERGRVHVVSGSPTGSCPACGNPQQGLRIVSLGIPEFLHNSNVSAAGTMIHSSHTDEDGIVHHRFQDLVSQAWGQQDLLQELLVCEACIGAAAELVGYGDLTDAEADRDEALEHARGLQQQLADATKRLAELEDSLAQSCNTRLELETALRSLQRGQPAEAPPADPAPADPAPSKSKPAAGGKRGRG